MHHVRRRLSARKFTFLLVLVSGATASYAGEWPGWRGPHRDGKSLDKGLLKEWPDGGPRLTWKLELRPLALQPLPLGSIRPAGWLERQLRIQADGLTGHLDEFWPDVQRSGWIGGKAEGWERAPYWLDGLVPLAFLLRDENLKEKAKKFIDYTLEHQLEDGWLGPEKSAKGRYKARDPWPVFVMMKVLTQYQEATRDPRVIPALTRFLRTLHKQLAERPLFDWNRMRWQDGVVSVYWLYDRTGEKWLLDLAAKLHEQGYDWIAHFGDLPHKEKAKRWRHESHVVNNAMGVKAPAVWSRQSGDAAHKKRAVEALSVLDRYHGQASGIFTGDECFAGKMPSQGTETCAVVEFLYSLEEMLAALGESALGDRLERIAFNALPAPFKPDMWARQYVQQANQVVSRVSNERIYTTNGNRANVYGLETNYGCCTANMHQGWPKFASSLVMKTPDGGLAAVAYAPCVVETEVAGANVRLELATDYPFRDKLEFTVKVSRRVRFPLKLRVPAWTRGATLDVAGEGARNVRSGTFHTVAREWEGATRLELVLPMKISFERRFNDAASVHRGPLLFSLKIGESWKRIAGKEPHADWEVHPTTPWNYALAINEKHPEHSVAVKLQPVADNPFHPDTAPVHLSVKGKQVPDWGLERNAAAPPPRSPVSSGKPVETLTLIPYGAAKLRVTEFPVLEELD